MNARELTQRLGGKWHGSYGLARCPAHDDREPSLSIQAGETAPLVTCHSGCDRSTIIAVLRQMGLWSVSDRRRSKPVNLAPSYPTPAAPTLEAVWTWQGASPGQSTLVERYLRTRGITGPIPDALRYAPDLSHPKSDDRHPAMVAAITSSIGAVVAIQRTFLAPDGLGKAAVDPPKMGWGQQGDGSVRLAPAEDELGLAEGIETALSIMELGGPPTWAVMSCNRLASVAVPACVRTLHIFRDSGLPGLQGAQKAVERHTAAGRRVLVHSPPDGFDDFNDVLTADPDEEAA